MDAGILDGELFQGTGSDGVDSVFAARSGRGQDLAFAAFDLLAIDGLPLTGEPWAARRCWLEVLLDGRLAPHVQLIPVGKDARSRWKRGRGGAGR
jgi:ATP-dependent DNA ligase